MTDRPFAYETDEARALKRDAYPPDRPDPGEYEDLPVLDLDEFLAQQDPGFGSYDDYLRYS